MKLVLIVTSVDDDSNEEEEEEEISEVDHAKAVAEAFGKSSSSSKKASSTMEVDDVATGMKELSTWIITMKRMMVCFTSLLLVLCSPTYLVVWCVWT